jgi:hypothetical protein
LTSYQKTVVKNVVETTTGVKIEGEDEDNR